MSACEHVETIAHGVTKTWTHDMHGHIIEEVWTHDLEAQRIRD